MRLLNPCCHGRRALLRKDIITSGVLPAQVIKAVQAHMTSQEQLELRAAMAR